MTASPLPRRRPQPWPLAVLAGCAALVIASAGPAHAAPESCGPIALQAGQIRIGKPLTAAWVTEAAGKQCLGEIVQAVDKNRLVRAVTVSFRAPDSERQDGKALASAKQVADALVTAGLPRNRVFAVASRSAPDEASGIVIRYTERAPDNVVARIANLSGSVRVGPDDKSLRTAEVAMPLLTDDTIQTGSDGQAVIQLRDGSAVRLLRGCLVKFAKLGFGEGSDGATRTVKLDVLRGQVEADVRKAGVGSSFEVSSRVAVASVRGTVLRFGNDDRGQSRLETVEGRVLLGSAVDRTQPPVEVPAGQGARVSDTGKVEPPQPLPAAPAIVGPLRGALPASAELSFAAVPGATQYRIELAQDADFILQAQEFTTPTTPFVLPRRPAPGKWFWRVTAMNAAGFSGATSKVHAFDVTP